MHLRENMIVLSYDWTSECCCSRSVPLVPPGNSSTQTNSMMSTRSIPSKRSRWRPMLIVDSHNSISKRWALSNSRRISKQRRCSENLCRCSVRRYLVCRRKVRRHVMKSSSSRISNLRSQSTWPIMSRITRGRSSSVSSRCSRTNQVKRN